MALSPEQRKRAHEAGLRRKAEREARMAEARARNSRIIGGDYERFRRVGLSHEEAIAEIEKRKIAEERFKQSGGTSARWVEALTQAPEVAATASTAMGGSPTTCLSHGMQ